jgi:hypothetical protein
MVAAPVLGKRSVGERDQLAIRSLGDIVGERVGKKARKEKER